MSLLEFDLLMISHRSLCHEKCLQEIYAKFDGSNYPESGISLGQLFFDLLSQNIFVVAVDDVADFVVFRRQDDVVVSRRRR